MKKFFLTCLFILLASPAWATTYFLAPASAGGNDANNGLSAGSPWLSPNHSLNCGDVIIAAASTSYSEANFASGKWGPVTCPSANNVAWLKCATFDGCKITTSTNASAMMVSANYWGVQGWEATATSGSVAGCFQVRPPGSSSVHHVIFANDIANSCFNGGFSAYNNGSASVDYVVYVGNVAFNAAQTSSACTSGFNIYQPVKSDSVAGTHIYVAGNFSYKNMNPVTCAGTPPTDGEGLIFDTFDGSQGGLPAPYDQQAVAYNNMFLANGGRGFEIFNNQSGSAHSHVYVYSNTSWGNEADTHQNSGGICSEIELLRSLNTQVYNNIAQTTASTGCGGYILYDYGLWDADTTVGVYSNVGDNSAGHYVYMQTSGSFAPAPSNIFGTNPNFTNPVIPAAPSCGLATSVANCMAPVIANFTPTTPAAKAYGYQVPSTSPNSDPLFPQWLCNVNLPAGLVTMGCLSSSSSRPSPVTITNVTVK
jgi:hypothetical protein